MERPADGVVDTNVFIHARSTDRFAEECRGFLAAVERGDVRAHLDPIILYSKNVRELRGQGVTVPDPLI